MLAVSDSDVERGRACCAVDVDAMRIQLASGADAAQHWRGKPPALHVARAIDARYLSEGARTQRQVDALRLLAEHGGLTPDLATHALHEAVSSSASPAVVEALLAAGANCTVRSPGYGSTLLHVVQRPDVVPMLIAAGCDVSAVQPGTCKCPLHSMTRVLLTSVEPRQPALVAALIVGGADVNALDAYGETCLAEAADRDVGLSRVALVPQLLDAGADPTIATTWGTTPLSHLLGEVTGWATCSTARVRLGNGSPLRPACGRCRATYLDRRRR